MTHRNAAVVPEIPKENIHRNRGSTCARCEVRGSFAFLSAKISTLISSERVCCVLRFPRRFSQKTAKSTINRLPLLVFFFFVFAVALFLFIICAERPLSSRHRYRGLHVRMRMHFTDEGWIQLCISIIKNRRCF